MDKDKRIWSIIRFKLLEEARNLSFGENLRAEMDLEWASIVCSRFKVNIPGTCKRENGFY